MDLKRIKSSQTMLQVLLVGLLTISTLSAASTTAANNPAAKTVDILADQKTTNQIGSTQSSAAPTSPLPSSNKPPAQQHPSKNEFYIDDEGLEGSGGRGEVRDDLERESDYSGSGLGPDDEDAIHSIHRTNLNTGSTNLGGGKGGSSSSGSRKDNINNSNNSNRQNSGSVSGGGNSNSFGDNFAGSGDGGDDQENDDDEDERINEDDLYPGPDDIDEEVPEDDLGFNEDEDEDDAGKHTSNNLDEDFKINSGRQPPAIDPSTSDDEDFDTEDTKPTDGKDSINRGLDRGHDLDQDQTKHSGGVLTDSTKNNDVFIMNTKNEDRTASFFSQPGILAAVIGGAVVGLLCAILVVMFIVYRMRKKDEGSYALDEPKRSPAVNSYAKNTNNREFYA